MALTRDDPYGDHSFHVDLGTGQVSGFSEVTLPEGSIDVIEYREGGDARVRKIPGQAKYSTITLKRGVVGALDLYQWWNQARTSGIAARRNVRIQLLSDDRSQVVLVWLLRNAWPVRYKFSGLNAKGKEVLVEVLELAFDDFEVE